MYHQPLRNMHSWPLKMQVQQTLCAVFLVAMPTNLSHVITAYILIVSDYQTEVYRRGSRYKIWYFEENYLFGGVVKDQKIIIEN